LAAKQLRHNEAAKLFMSKAKTINSGDMKMAAKQKELHQDLQQGSPQIKRLYPKNLSRQSKVNLNDTERWVSNLAGGGLAVWGLKQGGWKGCTLALLGGGLIYRGLTGHCQLYDTLGINTVNGKGRAASVKHGEGIRIEKSVTINQSPEELYRFWRNFENLPRFMNHLEAVNVLDNQLSHWVIKAPAGMNVEWDAQIINEKENEMIAWRSLEGATIPNAGSVHFTAAPEGRGTILKVEINYDAPGGALTAAIAKLFGEEPGQQVQEDLRRLKQLLETGEATTAEAQPSAKPFAQEKNDAPSMAFEPNRQGETHEEKPADRILAHGR
jgi:uncharacterized membrane protein